MMKITCWLIALIVPVSCSRNHTNNCPIPFKLSKSKIGQEFCYYTKTSEYDSLYSEQCSGNIFTIELYNELAIPWEPHTKYILTQYKSAYPGGPFIDWSYTSSTGRLLNETVEPLATADTDTCVVVDSKQRYKSVSCNENIRKYCIIHTYDNGNPLSTQLCGNSREGIRFYNPASICVIFEESLQIQTLRQTQTTCKNYDADLIGHGWIYTNYNWTHIKIPLSNIIAPSKESYLTEDYKIMSNQKSDSNIHLFKNFACEVFVPKKSLILNLTLDSKERLVLKINEPVDNKLILCFVDEYYPTKVELYYEGDIRVLKGNINGYYWCVNIDTTNFTTTQSNKILYIPDKESIEQLYTAKLKLNEEKTPAEFDKVTEKLNEFLYLSYSYYKKHKDINEVTEDTLKDFYEVEGVRTKNVLSDVRQRKWLVRDSLLWLHFNVDFCMTPAYHGTWKGIKVLYIRYVFYCQNRTDQNAMKGNFIGNSRCEIPTNLTDLSEGISWTNISYDQCQQNDQELVVNVTSKLESLIKNNSSSISVETINKTIQQVDNLLSEYKEVEINGTLLNLLDEAGVKLELNNATNVQIVNKNIALVTAKANIVKALRVTSNTDGFTDDAVELLNGEIDSSILASNASSIVAKIPEWISESIERISFVVFNNDRAFRNPESVHTINSKVISIKIGNLTQFQDDKFIDIYLNPTEKKPGKNQKRVCVYWEFLEDGAGRWSEEGCILVHSKQKGMLGYCRCAHLTHFAEILIPKTRFSEVHEKLLEFISIVGCFISILGLIVVGVTASTFRSWSRNLNNKIWLQLCLSIFLTSLCFLAIVFINFTERSLACILIGIVLHYSTLTCCCWMLVAALISYRKLVVVFSQSTSKILLKASVFSWGTPCVVIGILHLVAPESYSAKFNEKLVGGSFCYPSGLSLWLTVYAPVALMFFVNCTLFILILRSFFASRRIQKHGDANEMLRFATISCFLVFLFGLPWVFALFRDNIVTVYLFTVSASFQGFVLFLFFVPCNKKTRDLWFNKMKQTGSVSAVTPTAPSRSTNETPLGRDTSQESSETRSTNLKCLACNTSRF